MNQDRIQGRWKQWKGKLKEQWGKLTEDDLDVIAGRRDQLLGRIQERHGLARDRGDAPARDDAGAGRHSLPDRPGPDRSR